MALHTPSCEPGELMEFGDLPTNPLTPAADITQSVLKDMKRRKISPIAQSSTTSDLEPELTEDEQRVHASVLSTIASWIGELNHNMQEAFNAQFEQAVSEMKTDLIEHISSIDIIDSLNNTSKCVEELEQEIHELKENSRVLEGRLTRTEKVVEELKEQLLYQEARSMRDNLKFFNIPEQQGENCERTLYDFLHFEMKIGDDDMRRIRFDRLHRVGPYIRGQSRLIVAFF